MSSNHLVAISPAISPTSVDEPVDLHGQRQTIREFLQRGRVATLRSLPMLKSDRTMSTLRRHRSAVRMTSITVKEWRALPVRREYA